MLKIRFPRMQAGQPAPAEGPDAQSEPPGSEREDHLEDARPLPDPEADTRRHRMSNLLRGIRLDRLPIRPHPILRADTVVRHRYAAFLTAILLTQGEPSPVAQRLLTLLLRSLQVPVDAVGARLAAQALDQAGIEQFFAECRTGSHGTSFLLDAIILCRLGGPLTRSTAELLGELADLLDLDERATAHCASLASQVLGLAGAEPLPWSVDFRFCAHFDEFLVRDLTAEHLQLHGGVTGGRWRLRGQIDVRTPCRLEDASLEFEPGARLSFASGTLLSVRRCSFHLPRIDINGPGDLVLEDCRFVGRYSDQDGPVTALRIEPVAGTRVLFRRVQARTINARFLRCLAQVSGAHAARILYEDCQFTECGHPALSGGVAAVNVQISAHRTLFRHNRARIGSAVAMVTLEPVQNSFQECLFDGGESADRLEVVGADEPLPGGIAVVAVQGSGDALRHCAFRQAHVLLRRRDGDPVLGGNHHGSFLASEHFQPTYEGRAASYTRSRHLQGMDPAQPRDREIERTRIFASTDDNFPLQEYA